MKLKMSDKGLVVFQLGKNGLNEKFLEMLAFSFNTREMVKISVLKSCCRNKEELEKMKEKIKNYLQQKLKKEIVIRVVGFTIAIRKHRRSIKS